MATRGAAPTGRNGADVGPIMRITPLTTDDALLAELGARVEHARLSRDWAQARLAEEAGIGERTLKRLEAGEGTTLRNFLRVLDLVDGLEALVPEPGPSPVQQAAPACRRRRASGTTPVTPPRPDPGGVVVG